MAYSGNKRVQTTCQKQHSANIQKSINRKTTQNAYDNICMESFRSGFIPPLPESNNECRVSGTIQNMSERHPNRKRIN